MIRKLVEQDRNAVLAYLYQEPTYNIFLIGDIESVGFDADYMTVFAEIDELGNYQGVFLNFRDNGIYYSHQEHFNPEFFQHQPLSAFTHFSGKKELMDLIEPYLVGFKHKPMYFCQASNLLVEPLTDKSNIKIMKTQEECERLYDLLATIEEFGIYKRTKEQYVEGHMKSLDMGITMYLEEDAKIISTVSTTAETTKNAMVVAVATDLSHRQKGYTTMLMTAVMQYYFEIKKKELCLFFDNPSAGKIYLRLGFKEIGMWDVYDRVE